jgi:wobble nucleotide-excising tRNase
MEEYKIVGDKVEITKEPESLDIETVYNENKQKIENLEYEIRHAQAIIDRATAEKEIIESLITIIEPKVEELQAQALIEVAEEVI